MSQTAAAGTGRSLRPTAVALVVLTALLGILASRSASSTAPFSEVLRGDERGPTTEADVPVTEADVAVTEADGAVTEADGVLPDGVTVLDDDYPGVANLDPDLLQALRQAATDAADEGVELYVNSGWRSAEYQNQLLREAVSAYGSEEEAARWVATADTSAHVSGDAVDIGHFDATAWLSEHGARYGLCQIYSNEPWHYELRPQAVDHGCPLIDTDRPRPPRMQR